MSSSTSTNTTGLQAEQLRDFERDGYLVVPALFDVADLRELGTEIHALWLARQQTQTSREEQQNIHDLGRQSAKSKELALNQRLIACMRQLMQVDLAIFSIKVIGKDPGATDTVCHWHQDEAYWHERWPASKRISAWIPLQDCDQHNGCLRVRPGSHRWGLSEHEPRSSRSHGSCRLSYAHGDTVHDDEVACPVAAGDVILFDRMTHHASHGNSSDDFRRVLIVTYQDANAPSSQDREYIKI